MNELNETRMADTFGVVLTARTVDRGLSTLDDAYVRGHYGRSGAVLLRDFRTSLDSFAEFSERFIRTCVLSGSSTRVDVTKDGTIQTVHAGTGSIPLHAELASTPLRPDILMFYCLTPSGPASGETLLCDGVAMWDKMDPSVKGLFERSRLKYTFTRSQRQGIVCRGHESRIRGDRRVDGFTVNEDGSVSMEFTVPAVAITRHSKCRAFANSVILKASGFEDGSPVPDDVRRAVSTLAETLSHRLCWNQGDVLIVDNSRMMHGRTSIIAGDVREIVLRMGFETV